MCQFGTQICTKAAPNIPTLRELPPPPLGGARPGTSLAHVQGLPAPTGCLHGACRAAISTSGAPDNLVTCKFLKTQLLKEALCTDRQVRQRSVSFGNAHTHTFDLIYTSICRSVYLLACLLACLLVFYRRPNRWTDLAQNWQGDPWRPGV